MKICKNALMKGYLSCDMKLDAIYTFNISPGMYVSSIETTRQLNGIVIPLDGCAEYVVSGTHYQLKKGTILLSGGGLELSKRVIGDEPFSYILIHYKITPIESIGDYVLPLHFVLTLADLHLTKIKRLADQMLTNQKRGDLMSTFNQKSLLWRTIEEIFEFGFDKCVMNENEKIEKVKKYIYENINRDLSVVELSDYINEEPKRFAQLFCKKMGLCPKKYIIQTKIHYAKELLLQTNLTVQEVSYKIGYEDPFYFSRIFKKNTGFAPSIYKTHVKKVH